MQRHGQLDDAQPGAEMAAGDGDGRDRLLPQLVGKLAQLFAAQAADIGGRVDSVEKRRRALGRTLASHAYYYTPARRLTSPVSSAAGNDEISRLF